MAVCASVSCLSTQQDFKQALATDVRVSMTSIPKWFPIKYLYDDEGSALFEKIVCDPNYYPYHAEKEILKSCAMEVMLTTQPYEVVELGSGSSTKTRLLLEAMNSVGCTRYVPVDISESILCKAVEDLTHSFPWLHVNGYLGNFNSDLHKIPRIGRRLIVFLGGTVGSFNTKAEQVEFLKHLSATMEKGDHLLMGIDVVRAIEDIECAHSSKRHLRQQFYFHSLKIMNSKLGANFDEENFEVQTIWNPTYCSVDTFLVAQDDLQFTVRDLDLDVTLSKHEKIKIASSVKFTKEGITEELSGVGLNVVAWYSDSDGQFAEVLVFQPEHS